LHRKTNPCIYFTPTQPLPIQFQSNSDLNTTNLSNFNASQPLILFWTKFFGKDISRILQINHKCPYTCSYSYSKEDQAFAKARVFHIRDFSTRKLPVRNPDAYNVYFTLESPPFSNFYNPSRFLRNSYEDYFNLTITYRSNADIYYPYDAFVEMDGSEGKEDVWTEEQVSFC
jgi:hypothetical protein